MFKRILVPLDGSQLAELALPYAETLAGAFDSEVALTHVCEVAEKDYRHMHQLYLEETAKTVGNRIKRASSAARVKAVVLDGEPATQIMSFAQDNDVSLTIMVTHGRSGIMAWALGSVGNKVLQRVSTPLLLIRAKGDAAKAGKGQLFSRVLVPLDGSEAGEAALPYVKELASKFASEVIFLQVVPPGQYVHTVGGLNYVRFPDSELELMRKQAMEYLEEVGTRLRDIKASLKFEVRIGDAAHEIIKGTTETRARLVAMSTHGRSGIGGWFFGSTAQKVLHAGRRSLLLVRAPISSA